jgi:hypothetical protein
VWEGAAALPEAPPCSRSFAPRYVAHNLSGGREIVYDGHKVVDDGDNFEAAAGKLRAAVDSCPAPGLTKGPTSRQSGQTVSHFRRLPLPGKRRPSYLSGWRRVGIDSLRIFPAVCFSDPSVLVSRLLVVFSHPSVVVSRLSVAFSHPSVVYFNVSVVYFIVSAA